MLYKQVSAYIDQYFITANAFIRSKKCVFIKEQREYFFYECVVIYYSIFKNITPFNSLWRYLPHKTPFGTIGKHS